ncbi:hypothetical protein IPZ70_33520 [Streptomyces polychromogenes]|nr:hypothetical protein [Streptomyces polychromogenes]
MAISLTGVVVGLVLWTVLACIPVRAREVRLPYLAVIALVSFGGIGVQAIRFLTAEGDAERAQWALFTIVLLVPGGLIALVRLLGAKPASRV